MGAPNPGGGVRPGRAGLLLRRVRGDLGVVAGISSGSGAANSVVSVVLAEHLRCHRFLEQRCEVRSAVACADFATVVHPPPNGWTTDRPVRPGRTTRLGLIPRRAQPARSVTPTVTSGRRRSLPAF